VGWDALLDLYCVSGIAAVEVVLWLMVRLERRRSHGPRRLAREMGIRRQTAVNFLKGPWVHWARFALSGTAIGRPPLRAPVRSVKMEAVFRETLGNALGPSERAAGREEE